MHTYDKILFENVMRTFLNFLKPPETMFPTTSGGRGGGMMMKKSGTSGQAASANNATLPLNEALNVLIQGYIKGN